MTVSIAVDCTLTAVGIAAEVVLFVTGVKHNLHRTLPIFCSYLALLCITDVVGVVVDLLYSPNAYWTFYVIQSSCVILCELLIACDILRIATAQSTTHFLGKRSRTMFLFCAVALIAISIGAWFICPAGRSDKAYFYVDSVLNAVESLVFLSLLWFLSSLRIKHEPVVYVTWLFATYSAITLACHIIQEANITRGRLSNEAAAIDQIRSGSWIVLLVWLIWKISWSRADGNMAPDQVSRQLDDSIASDSLTFAERKV